MEKRLKVNRMILVDLIETFEDFLDERGIVVENDEKLEDEGASNIYGTDFGMLGDSITDVLHKYGIDVPFTFE